MFRQRSSLVAFVVLTALVPTFVVSQEKKTESTKSTDVPKAVFAGQKYAIHDVKYLRDEKGETYSIVAKLSVLEEDRGKKSSKQKEEDEPNEPEIGTAFLIFEQDVSDELLNLRNIERSFNVTVGGSGTRTTWRVTAAKGKVTGSALNANKATTLELKGRTGAIKLNADGLDESQYGLIVHEGFEPKSNVLRFKKKDFKVGDASKEFESLVKTLPKSPPAK